MDHSRTKTNRRAFLSVVTAPLWLRLSSSRFNSLFQSSLIPESLFDELRNSLLTMVNDERSAAGISQLNVDPLATRVATAHAKDMAERKFASHWGSDGQKPYQRYSFAGGIHATQENVSAADNTWSLKPADLKQDVAYLHVRLYGEVAPADGHRRTILAPEHTHVGFGIAVEELRLRVVELFVAKHVELGEIVRRAKPEEVINLSGRVITPGHSIQQIQVFYEPLPKPPELSWLRMPRSYSLPEEVVTLHLKLPNSLKYVDGTSGVIESDGRNFRAPVTLFRKDPGIYTIVCWLRKGQADKPFRATELCIRVE